MTTCTCPAGEQDYAPEMGCPLHGDAPAQPVDPTAVVAVVMECADEWYYSEESEKRARLQQAVEWAMARARVEEITLTLSRRQRVTQHSPMCPCIECEALIQRKDRAEADAAEKWEAMQ